MRTITLARNMSDNKGTIRKTNSVYEEMLKRQEMLI